MVHAPVHDTQVTQSTLYLYVQLSFGKFDAKNIITRNRYRSNSLHKTNHGRNRDHDGNELSHY